MSGARLRTTRSVAPMYPVGRREDRTEHVAQEERKPIPTREQLIAELKAAAAARKHGYKENQAPPPSRPDPSQDVPRPDVGNRGW